MAIEESVLKALMAAGASPDMLVAAHRAYQRAQVERDLERLANSRAKNADRQRRYRERQRTPNNVTERDAASQKENPPDPHKKNTPPVPKGTSPRARKGRRCQLPDWVPVEPWKALEESRRAMGRPLTSTARKLLVAKLDQLRQEGFDPTDVLNQSVERGWKTVWPLPDRPAGTMPVPPPMSADELERAAQFREDHGDKTTAAEYRREAQLQRGEA